MDAQQIIKKITDALKICSDKYGINPNAIQIKIDYPKTMFEGIKFFVMNSLEIVKDGNGKNLDVSIKELLNLTALEAEIVKIYLKDTLASLATKKKLINVRQVNARIFTKSIDFIPSVCLYEDTKLIGEITLEELTTK